MKRRRLSLLPPPICLSGSAPSPVPLTPPQLPASSPGMLPKPPNWPYSPFPGLPRTSLLPLLSHLSATVLCVLVFLRVRHAEPETPLRVCRMYACTCDRSREEGLGHCPVVKGVCKPLASRSRTLTSGGSPASVSLPAQCRGQLADPPLGPQRSRERATLNPVNTSSCLLG